ncbi:acyl-CoA carboxylase subunit epsilon [Streptomyces sp. S1A]|uniref:acyl-CoA carboxylase epsilon subunit n=1 Tax=Streptomyces sp. ICN903 TaxID=2964654 RepID=UPI001EDA9DA3|nr:acyl-CoA carboxylase epsilon subunit [Streptomyces sp. ICN903]MCG3041379.1 acyl-CoA carboxylase subunit epsilon [Streptomyces sp. ICN903]
MNTSAATTTATAVADVVRVEKGHASEEELAAVTALLLARAAAHGSGPVASRPRRSTAPWRRLERTSGFRAPHSWQG